MSKFVAVSQDGPLHVALLRPLLGLLGPELQPAVPPTAAGPVIGPAGRAPRLSAECAVQCAAGGGFE